jgi:hypothetical protein
VQPSAVVERDGKPVVFVVQRQGKTAVTRGARSANCCPFGA